MNMNIDNKNTKKALEHIELPQNLNQIIIESVGKGYVQMEKNKANKKAVFIKRAAAAAGIAAAVGLISIPAKALVSSLVQERMEQTPQEELEGIVQDLNQQDAQADSYSRNFTQQERLRMEEMLNAYGQGTFPAREIRTESTADDSIEDELYFALDSATFYLPERELSDEELLQMIDFTSKRDYAVAQGNAAWEQKDQNEQQEAKVHNGGSGGITEERAVEIGKDWLEKLFGNTGEGMQFTSYLFTDSATGSGMLEYSIGWGIRSIQSSDVVLDAQDGSLITASETITAEDIDGAPVTVNAAEEKLEGLYKEAYNVLVNTIGKEKEYEKAVYAYSESDGVLSYLNTISFFFVKSDGSAYEIGMSAVRDRLNGYQYHEDYEARIKELEDSVVASNEGSNFAMPEGRIVYREMLK